ncbi:glutamyl-Q tRNA(Asp) synthetase [Mariprofundus micogutta]|uniref:Glutamyl-Q tRNA(Asp) synthetase n=1 Tax=Mariprofundus micogutta TaxID=1921010 RepID=A0A1L8CM95_9PROT|nr:tRNA glutamyl-Q(34) synthetase GluQRS [Mariprofundus micogutta]GAV20033.1 glutamyl-Q tRNA(Asp) synthetase [Mariprofundus micogutta]
MQQPKTRFAPSPTGLLHVGNAYSALICQAWSKSKRAGLLLRIEDIDFTRCRSEFTEAIFQDLDWLGLKWPEPVRIQSEHFDDYRRAIEHLRELGVIYPCFCTRKSIEAEIQRIGLAPHAEEATAIYPGICRNLDVDEQSQRMLSNPFAWRLDIEKAMTLMARPLQWHDESGAAHPANIDHDVVIGRKDISFSYHLSVVVDDALQNISHIIRGQDLEASTGIHRLLQNLLDLPEPTYIHHGLLETLNGERLAKRNCSTTLRSLKELGVKPEKLKQFLLDVENPVWPFAPDDHDQIIRQLA